jgi:hypothetical protein
MTKGFAVLAPAEVFVLGACGDDSDETEADGDTTDATAEGDTDDDSGTDETGGDGQTSQPEAPLLARGGSHGVQLSSFPAPIAGSARPVAGSRPPARRVWPVNRGS